MNEYSVEIILAGVRSGIWMVIKETWWFWILVFLIWLSTELFPVIKEKILRERKYTKINSMKNDRQRLYELRKLKPWQFEEYIASLYSRLGYKTERVGQSHDGGIDVIAEKDNKTYYIQCKKHITSKVGSSDMRDFYGAVSARLATANGIFITTNIFTTEAKKFAEDNMIDIIDGFALLDLIKVAEGENNLEKVSEIDKEVEKCPKCGGSLILRSSKYGDFYGCSSFPKCRFIKQSNNNFQKNET